YSVGCILYESITGKCPFAEIGLFSAPYNESELLTPSKISGSTTVPQPLDKIVLRALRLNPVERYQSANHFKSDLQALLKS
ncbi:hypothetical protein ACO1MT_15270, partial [Staphylococcus aureus]